MKERNGVCKFSPKFFFPLDKSRMSANVIYSSAYVINAPANSIRFYSKFSFVQNFKRFLPLKAIIECALSREGGGRRMQTMEKSSDWAVSAPIVDRTKLEGGRCKMGMGTGYLWQMCQNLFDKVHTCTIHARYAAQPTTKTQRKKTERERENYHSFHWQLPKVNFKISHICR